MIRTLLLLPLLLLTAPLSAHADEETPLLYGGGGPDDDAAQEARKSARDPSATPRWFLSASPPLVPGLHRLGPGVVDACAGPVLTLEEMKAQASEAFDLLDLVLPDEASAAYEALAERLPCLGAPPEPATLSLVEFNRAIAALTRAERDPDLGALAFAAAIASAPETPWNEDYSAFPRSVFFETKVRLLTTERAHVRVAVKDTTGGTQFFLQGRQLGAEVEGNVVLAGRHLLQIVRGGETLWRGTLTLEPGEDVVLGDPESLYDIVTRRGQADDEVARAFTVRAALSALFGEALRVVRPGAVATVALDGELGEWSDEGAYKVRPRLDVGGSWMFLEKTIESPALDAPLPSSHHGLPHVAVGVQFLPAVYARLALALALSGPFEIQGVRKTRLIGMGRLGVGVERPEGRVRPGGRIDLTLGFPGRLDLAGEPAFTVLLGPLGVFTLAFGATEVLWFQLEVGGGWVGSEVITAGGSVQLRLPPPRRRGG
ncbi:MAG: hypothetical protein KDA24_25395 [Deltaproteobacteria bacterium]|nr:hypothetical protein [Deltaproteobacteria bacterium]